MNRLAGSPLKNQTRKILPAIRCKKVRETNDAIWDGIYRFEGHPFGLGSHVGAIFGAFRAGFASLDPPDLVPWGFAAIRLLAGIFRCAASMKASFLPALTPDIERHQWLAR